MAVVDSIEFEVKIGVSEETVASCIAILNTWLKEKDNRIVVYEREDGTLYIEVL